MVSDGQIETGAADQGKPTRDLNSAIATCFSPYLNAPPFPERLTALTAALTNSRGVSVWSWPTEQSEAMLIARAGQDPSIETVTALLGDAASESGTPAPSARFIDGHLVAHIALPDGGVAALLLSLPHGGPSAQSISYERVTTLSHLSFAQFRNPDVIEQTALTNDVAKIAAQDKDAMQSLVDRLARLTGADYAAAALWRNDALNDLTISGQEKFTKRALLPDRLKSALRDTAEQRLTGHTRYFAPVSGRKDGLALMLENPRRAPAVLPMTAALFSQADHGQPPPRSWARTVRYAAFGLIVFGIGMIPIPDGVRINAKTEALNKRIVTAPFTAVLQSVAVEDGARVSAGQTLATLDTQDIEIELIGLNSERAAAVIEQETARLSGNAAVLRNAELTVAQLDSQISLLERQKRSGEIVSQIAGVAVLDTLKQQIGTTVRQGDPLLDVSDPDGVTLTLTVLEGDIGKVVAGDQGLFRPDFDPTTTYAATITQVSPAIDIAAEVPSAQASARFDAQTIELRPGLSGLLLVGESRRPIWQVLYRNLRDWLLLRVWI